MKYFSLILFIYYLIDLLISKKAGMCGWYTTKDEDPFSYYLFVALAVFAIIFDVLYIFDVF